MLLLIAFILASSACATLAAPATYDQQQTGDLNVQVHLKDVQIVALLDSGLLGNYGDYDYNYDYADFTIKPIGGSTTSSSSSGSTTTVKPWNTWPTIAPSSSTTSRSPNSSDKNSTGTGNSGLENIPDKNTTLEKPSDGSSHLEIHSQENSAWEYSSNKTSSVLLEESHCLKPKINNKTENMSNDEDIKETEDVPSASLGELTTKLPSKKRCDSGYARDKKGRCRQQIRRRNPLLPFGIRLAPKLMQQLRYNQ